ncbi:MAG TPA: BON domain-containing protein [Bryobacteraceae bacterium]|nr:BON domain-containing protein [Bryobacteraceae bacterium]
MFRIRIALLIPAVLACLLAGCGGSAPSDQSVTTDIQSKLYADATTKPANISVAVKDGVVTLSGDVPSSDVELEAMKIANGTAGVKSVSDQLKVNAAAAPGNQAAAPAPAQAQSSYPPTTPAPAASTSPAGSTGQRERTASSASATIPAGQRISVQMTDAIDSSKNSPGQDFQASLDAPVTSGDRVVLPAGTPCTVTLENVASAGRIKGQSELAVRLTSISYRGRTYRTDTAVVEQQGKARGKQTAIRTGIGAAAGAIIGGLAGGGKGAAIGSAAGGGAGFGINALTHGPQVKIPSETVLTFQLQSPLSIERR